MTQVSKTLQVPAHCNGLLRKFSKCSNEVKLKLFNAYCTSVYTGPLWVKYKVATLNKAKVAYNTILRKLLGIARFADGINYSASHMFVHNNVLSFNELMRKCIYSFSIRVDNSDNEFIIQMNSSVVKIRSKIWQYWRRTLHTDPLNNL